MFPHQMFSMLTKYFVNTFLFLIFLFLLSYGVTIVFCHLKNFVVTKYVVTNYFYLFIYFIIKLFGDKQIFRNLLNSSPKTLFVDTVFCHKKFSLLFYFLLLSQLVKTDETSLSSNVYIFNDEKICHQMILFFIYII